jgi:hypothetical protein
VLLEDATGRPTQERPCPYCQGQQNQGWVSAKREATLNLWDKRRKSLIIATIAMFLLNGWSAWDPSGGDGQYIYSVLFLIHIVLWLALIVGWWAWWANRRPKEEKPGFTPKHAPGFTDDRERNALALFGLGLAARNALGHLFKDKQ